MLYVPPAPPPYVCAYADSYTAPCTPPPDPTCPYVSHGDETVLMVCVEP